MDEEEQLKQKMQERFLQLPKPVREAITSADVEKKLRELADTHKLHIDQWDLLENEVRLTLLGFERPEDLENHIRSEVGVSAEVARALAENISTIIFEPVRQELERQLTHPDAKAATQSDIEASRTQILGSSESVAAAQPVVPPPVPAVTPATPPQPAPTTPVIRMPASGDYKPGEASTERKSVVDDPYREPPK